MSYREHKIAQTAELLREGVYDGALGPVAMFAEHLAGNGSLGLGMTLHAGTTVEQMVEHYVSDGDGQIELSAWAKDEAEGQQIEAEMEGAA
ncbi:MAG: hypothetical protein U9Q35_01150 [Pseudomonadota bacterium]|nr:hypothetical protein [Pseudomonadota bacterium]